MIGGYDSTDKVHEYKETFCVSDVQNSFVSLYCAVFLSRGDPRAVGWELLLWIFMPANFAVSLTWGFGVRFRKLGNWRVIRTERVVWLKINYTRHVSGNCGHGKSAYEMRPLEELIMVCLPTWPFYNLSHVTLLSLREVRRYHGVKGDYVLGYDGMWTFWLIPVSETKFLRKSYIYLQIHTLLQLGRPT